MIDSHVHFWDPARLSYDWLKHVPSIAGARLPQHFAEAGSVAQGSVFVQANCAPEQAILEVDWVEHFAVTGIVAYAPLELGFEVAPHLAVLKTRPRVKGVRRNAQNEADGFMLGRYTDGMVAAAEAGLSIDMCIRAHQMAEMAEALTAVPDATVILDHLGKPDIAKGEFDAWAKGLVRLAQFPNLFCKLSGLATQADWATWQPDEVSPYLAHAIEVFGPARCLFGSDWPVVDLAGGYRPWLRVLETAVAGLTPDEQELIWSGTARAVYKL